MSDKGTARKVVVIGAGMVAHRFITELAKRGGDANQLTVFGEESHRPYDRIALSSIFGESNVDLSLAGSPENVSWHLGDPVAEIDRSTRTVTTATGIKAEYDVLVLATGSRPFVPPVHGADAPGCFTYRTVDDVHAITKAAKSARRGVVVGGGLLGLEAAGALQTLGVDPTIVELADRLMSLQVDAGGGEALRRLVNGRGVEILTSSAAARVEVRRGRVSGLRLADERELPADILVFAVGVRPRDELGRSAGLRIAQRGGIEIDANCQTSDPTIFAIGECASLAGRVYGLVAPGYQMATAAAATLCGEPETVGELDTSTKLKLLGVDVGSFGDAFAQTAGALEVTFSDPVNGRYRKLVVSDDASTLLGGVLVGDANDYAALRAGMGGAVSGDIAALAAGMAEVSGDLPDSAGVCSCHNVTAGQIRTAIADGCHDIGAVKSCTKAATGCGSCLPLAKKILDAELATAGIEIDRSLCEHFAFTRPELFDLIRVQQLHSFTEVVLRHGTGRGCDICKPVVASILASLGRGHVLEGENAALQDTNDHVMANLQRDGTYSVVPRVPGGEITPTKLRAIADVAAKHDLYTKITGGQRIDLFGARIEQLPQIWRELVDAGFESGQAYGKSVRTVKSCVGSTWCRYGVQDSVGMAIALELRYRGLRAPHKIKLAVSGCARECAEARSKDVGVIATDKGWNLYVCGNGGFTPRHAKLLAEDLDDNGLVRTIDRFLMFYIRTSDRLQRTAAWLEALDGGIEYLRRVVVDDSLGLAADLESAMSDHVRNYADEWRTTLEDPRKLARFTSFVNAPEVSDPDPRYVITREQRQPTGTRLVDISIGRPRYAESAPAPDPQPQPQQPQPQLEPEGVR